MSFSFKYWICQNGHIANSVTLSRDGQISFRKTSQYITRKNLKWRYSYNYWLNLFLTIVFYKAIRLYRQLYVIQNLWFILWFQIAYYTVLQFHDTTKTKFNKLFTLLNNSLHFKIQNLENNHQSSPKCIIRMFPHKIKCFDSYFTQFGHIVQRIFSPVHHPFYKVICLRLDKPKFTPILHYHKCKTFTPLKMEKRCCFYFSPIGPSTLEKFAEWSYLSIYLSCPHLYCYKEWLWRRWVAFKLLSCF